MRPANIRPSRRCFPPTAARWLTFLLLTATLVSSGAENDSAKKAPRPQGPAGGANAAAVQMLVPGFAVRALPLDLPNLNTVRYRADGKLFALSFSGKVFALTDTDGDGLEDHAEVFYDPGRQHLSLAIALTPPGYAQGNGVFIARKGNITLALDTDGDDRADREILVASDWETPERYPGGASDVVGIAVAPSGEIYFGLEAANSQNGYLLSQDKSTAGYRLASERGTILKLSPDFSRREVIATGIRCSFGLAFNAAGDLFATEQEGATWMPNGNPFDELLHIQTARHYGFPPRHPKFLPAVIDEPSVVDYGPQHQSTCGLFFNESVNGGPVFGPSWWRSDALVAGESRGKLYRTKLVKTPSGYVGQTQIIAALGWLTIDQCVSPRGDLLVSAHSGPPDWGTGAGGTGRLFKLTRTDSSSPQPVLAYTASPTELRVTFDAALDADGIAAIAPTLKITEGLYVKEGDRFESFRPGYRAVKEQRALPRLDVPVVSTRLADEGRTLVVTTHERRAALPASLDLDAWPRKSRALAGELVQLPALSVGADFSGVTATWTSADGTQSWHGWLPHFDLQVARELTAASAPHARLWASFAQPGILVLRGQLDLWSMLRPALQPGERLDFALPAERVTVSFATPGATAPRISFPGVATPPALESNGHTTQLLRHSPCERTWLPVEVMLTTGTPDQPLHVSWSTAEDARPRALALRRVLVPWATPTENSTAPIAPPELAGGDRTRGKALFAMCAMCHGLNSEGSRVGPDLSNLVYRDYASVVKDIVDPSATINPNHVGYFITLKNGDMLTSVVLEDNTHTILLATPGGLPRLVPKSDIAEMKPMPVSLMPMGLDQALGPQGLKDLLTFLMLPPPDSAAKP